LIRKNTCMSLWSFQGTRGSIRRARRPLTPTSAVSQNSTA